MLCASAALVSVPSHAIIVFDPGNFARAVLEDVLHQAPELATNILTTINVINQYKTMLENLKALPTALRSQAESEMGRMTGVNINDWGLNWQNYHVSYDPDDSAYRNNLEAYLNSAFSYNSMPRDSSAIYNDLLQVPAMFSGNTLRNAQIDRNQYEALMDSMRQIAIQRKNSQQRQGIVKQAASELTNLPEKSELRAMQLNGLLNSLTYQQLDDLNKGLSQQMLNDQRTAAVRLAEREAARRRSLNEAKKMATQPTTMPTITQWPSF